MKLITKDTTLAEFERTRKCFVQCPTTGMVYKVEIIRLNLRSTDCYAWVTQTQGRTRGRHVRLISTPATVMERRAALLHRLQTKQFNIW